MSIQELQSVLQEHADEVVDARLVGRAAAARRQATGIRRRRRAAGVLVVAVVAPLMGAAFLGHNPLDNSDRNLDPVDRGHSVDLPVVDSFAGRELLSSKIVTDANEVVLQVPAGEHTELHAACWGVGPKYTFHVTLDGASPGEGFCEARRPDISQVAYGLTVAESARSHTLRFWITPSYPDIPDVPAGAFLMAAAYKSPDVATYVAGQEVYQLERATGDDYALAKHEESDAGVRAFRSTFTARDWVLPEIFTSVSPDREGAKVTLILDGIRQSDIILAARGYQTIGTRYRGPHTIELRIRGDVPPDAVLGVVWRTIQR